MTTMPLSPCPSSFESVVASSASATVFSPCSDAAATDPASLHPDMEPGLARQIADLEYVFTRVPLEALLHLDKHFARLSRGSYSAPGSKGCLMYLLTERLPSRLRITSKESLILFWTGKARQKANYDPEYQPAKWLVRAFDGQRTRRYCGNPLEFSTIRQVLDSVLTAHLSGDAPPAPAPLFPLHDEEDPARW